MPAIYKNPVGRLSNRNNFHRFVVAYINKHNDICCNKQKNDMTTQTLAREVDFQRTVCASAGLIVV
jgi:hypothetical protein